MRHGHEARQTFTALVRQHPNRIDLVRAALAIADEDRDDVNVALSLHLLDALVERTARQVASDDTIAAQATKVVEYLHNAEGLVGDKRTYDDPQNSYLHLVLERHVGIPLTLSLILLHVGTQLGLPFEPAGLPGHFMVRCSDPAGTLFLDPFNGQALDGAACRAFLHAQLGYDIHDPERFPSTTRRQVLARLLRNLKRSYFRRENMARALAATERILLVEPDSTEDVRDRGLLRARLGDIHRGLYDLEQYALLEPRAGDLAMVRQYAQTLAGTASQRN